jgi:hypothetical protein
VCQAARSRDTAVEHTTHESDADSSAAPRAVPTPHTRAYCQWQVRLGAAKHAPCCAAGMGVRYDAQGACCCSVLACSGKGKCLRTTLFASEMDAVVRGAVAAEW